MSAQCPDCVPVINRNFIFVRRPTMMTTMWWRRRRSRLNVLVSFLCMLFYWRKFNRPDIGGHACGRTRSVHWLFHFFLHFFFICCWWMANKGTKFKKNKYIHFWWHRPATWSVEEQFFFCSFVEVLYLSECAKITTFFFSIVILPTTDTFWHIYAGTQIADGQNGRTRDFGTYWYLYEFKTFQSVISWLGKCKRAKHCTLYQRIHFILFFCLTEWRIPLVHKNNNNNNELCNYNVVLLIIRFEKWTRAKYTQQLRDGHMHLAYSRLKKYQFWSSLWISALATAAMNYVRAIFDKHWILSCNMTALAFE